MTACVLLHGVGLDASMWDPFRAASRLDTHAYDLLGLGSEADRPGPYLLTDYVAQFNAEAPSGLVDVVGFSMGAIVAQAIALAVPQRIRRLVLVNAVHARSDVEQEAIDARVAEVRAGSYLDSIEPALERWFTTQFAAANPSVVEAVRDRMRTNDQRAYTDAYAVFATGDRDVAPRVAEISRPVLVVTGSDDQRSTPAMAHTLASKLPNGQAVVLDGLRHLVPLEVPEQLAAMVDDFLLTPDAP